MPRANLEAAQAKLSSYHQAKKIVAPDERMDIESARLNELSSQLTSAQAIAIESEARALKVRELAKKGVAADELAEVLGQPLIVNLKAEVLRAESKLTEVTGNFGKNHPEYRQAVAHVNESKRKLESEIENVTKGITNVSVMNQRRVAEIRGALAAQREKVLKLKEGRDDIGLLAREVESAQRAYDLAMQRFTQTNLEGQTNQTNVTLLSPAVEALRYSSPRVARNIFLSVVLGFVLGLAFAFLRELRDRRVRSVEDLRSLTDLPVLEALRVPGESRSGRLFGRVRPARQPEPVHES